MHVLTFAHSRACFLVAPTGSGWSSKATPEPGRRPGPSEVSDTRLAEHCGLTDQDVDAITSGWGATTLAALQTVLRHGGFVWQMMRPMTSNPRYELAPSAIDLIQPHTCAAYLRRECHTGHGTRRDEPMVWYLNYDHWKPRPTELEVDVALFLLVRGPYAWLGTAWMGCSSGEEPMGAHQTAYEPRPSPLLDAEYGVPLGHCREMPSKSSAGGMDGPTFVREYTQATVAFDCAQWKPKITLKPHGRPRSS